MLLADLSHQIRALTEGALVTAAPKVETKKYTRQTQPAAETKGWWNKGFLSDGRDKPNPGSSTPKVSVGWTESVQSAGCAPTVSSFHKVVAILTFV